MKYKSKLKIADFITHNPKTLNKNEMIIKAVEMFNENQIGSIIIINEQNNIVGILDRKDIEM